MKSAAKQNTPSEHHPDAYHQKAQRIQQYLDDTVEDAVEIIKNMKKKQAG